MAKEGSPQAGRTLDPLVTLVTAQQNVSSKAKVRGGVTTNPVAVTGLCFMSKGFNHTENGSGDFSGDSDTSSDDEGGALRCQRILQGEKSADSDATAPAREAAASIQLLQNRHLASCHESGNAYLWDLGTRRIVHQFGQGRGPGMALRRIGDKVMYHTRDDAGTVAIHSLAQAESFVSIQWETQSRTFCTASPCEGNQNLLALPSGNECYATVRDVRVSPIANPVAFVHGTGDEANERKHGMLSSLAMCMSSNDRPMLACGMESGSIFFHDLRALSRHCGLQVSPRKDPILAMDVSLSSSGALAIVGLAADRVDLMELPEENRGTVALVKVYSNDDIEMAAKLRARVGTCDLEKEGKPGVNVARFRSDGRLFAIGGWDHRLRIFDRTRANPMAVLRGHSTSVKAIDWAPDSPLSGLLATGSGDAKILIWRCFSASDTQRSMEGL